MTQYKKMVIGKDKKYIIEYKFEDEIIRINNTSGLRDYINSDKDSAMFIATAIKKQYYNEMGKTFGVSDQSVAIEIIGHINIGGLAEAVSKNVDKIPVVGDKIVELLRNKIIDHTDVIDIGENKENSQDNNRWIWDAIAKKHIFYTKQESEETPR